MTDNSQLILIYATVTPSLLLAWWCLRRRPARIKWLADSVRFYNQNSSLVINYWRNKQ